MSDEYTALSSLTDSERRLLATLLKRAGLEAAGTALEEVRVRRLSDGGMGSFEIWTAEGPSDRAFARQAADLRFVDQDGIDVLCALNVNASGEPIEVDVWKVDFSPVRHVPETL